MGDAPKIIQSGPFKGKKIKLASTAGIDQFETIAEDFMSQIFGFEPGEYLITDQSSLADFIGVSDMALADIHQRIRNIYGQDLSNLASGNLLEIFVRLDDRPSEQN